MRRILAPVIVLLVTACAPRTTVPKTDPGVLAEVDGLQGKIRVEQNDAGMRLLVIDGVVHGAWDPKRDGADAVVPLVRAMRPNAKTALIIGLGTGQTAGDFAAAGLDVKAVELEPQVIELARKYFGYKGHAIAGDGLKYLEDSAARYDIVLMDAFEGTRPPPGLVTDTALRLLRDRTNKGGVTVVRLLTEPRDPVVRKIARRARFRHVFGSGVGAELQTLVVTMSDRALNFVDVAGVSLWPVRMDIDAPAWADPVHAGDKNERTLRLVGYVHRLADGTLALDLPHWEMGAVRYLIEGEIGLGLRAYLQDEWTYPTQGEIGTDGPLDDTLGNLLGGGGVMRSDMRYSPVIADVSGTAQLLSLVHPDAASRVPKRLSRGTVTDDRVPYGGALYQLAVTQVNSVLDKNTWMEVQKAATPVVEELTALLSAGEVSEASAAAAKLAAFWSERMSPAFPPPRRTRRLEEALRTEAKRGATTAFAKAAACDRTLWIWEDTLRHWGRGSSPIDLALHTCIEQLYETAALTPDAPEARTAAGRYLYLFGEYTFEETGDSRAKIRRKLTLRKIKKRFPGLEEVEKPPRA